MLADCSICYEPLGGEHIPVAMPCGHLYCLDCATFWFNQADEQKCACCGRTMRGENMIRIWASSNSSQDVSPSASFGEGSRRLRRVGEEALRECRIAHGALEAGDDGQEDALTTALLRTRVFSDSLQQGDRLQDVQTIAHGIHQTLTDIQSILDRRAQLMQPPPPPAPDQSQEQLVRAHDKLTRRHRDTREHVKVLEQIVARNNEEERLLNRRLSDALNALEIAKRSLSLRIQESNRLKEELVDAQEEKDRCQKAEIRYKKKYHALKQEQDRLKKRARGSRSVDAIDNSLIVLPP